MNDCVNHLTNVWDNKTCRITIDKNVNECLKRMLNYIHTHFSETIRVSDVAAQDLISERACYRLFQSRIQCSPNAYITGYRLEKACALLRNSEESMTFAKNTVILFVNRPEVIYIAEILQFCSYGLYIPTIVQFVARLFPGRDHLIGQASVGSAYTAGSVIATFLGGKLLDAAGVSTTLLVIAAATLTGAVLFTVSTRSYRVMPEACCLSHNGDK